MRGANGHINIRTNEDYDEATLRNAIRFERLKITAYVLSEACPGLGLAQSLLTAV
jgi:hypothetical protein